MDNKNNNSVNDTANKNRTEFANEMNADVKNNKNANSSGEKK